MKKVYIFSATFLSLFCLASSALAVCPTGQICNPLNVDTFGNLLTRDIIPAVSGVVASLSVIMIIVAGILYLTSAGSPEKIKTAKTALIYAVIGIVIAIAASAIAGIITRIIGVPTT